MRIFGSGMAGLLAASVLRRHEPVVYEAQDSLPNNHAALLRFRSQAVSEATGIPFREVDVIKGIVIQNELCSETTIEANNRYSRKVTGKILSRSSVNLAPSKRFIAPPNFIEQCSRGADIRFGNRIGLTNLKPSDGSPIISTLPMPVLMDIVGWPEDQRPDFDFLPIWSYSFDIPIECDVYQTVYFPDEFRSYYRASITGNKFILEFIERPVDTEIAGELSIHLLKKFFGIDIPIRPEGELKFQKFGKLQPADEEKRRNFIIAMTEQHNIYSLGRFATWRQILLDDVVNDIKVISQFIDNKTAYERMLKAKGE